MPRPDDVERALAADDIANALRLGGQLYEANPADSQALLLYASSLRAAGQPRRVISLLDARVFGADSIASAKTLLGIAQGEIGDFAAAAASFSEALGHAPEDFRVRLTYAECLDALGEADQALPQYFRAIHDAQARGRWLDDASTARPIRDRVKRAMDVVDEGRALLFDRVMEPHRAAHGMVAMQRVADAVARYLGGVGARDGDERRPKFLFVDLPATPFFERNLFPWYEELESRVDAIRGEMHAVMLGEGGIVPFLETRSASDEEAYLGGQAGERAWNAFFFHRHGETFIQNLAKCPATASALKAVPLTWIRDHAPEVLFSILAPHTHIKPHYGVTNTRVVTHLPLVIPDGDCRLVVGGREHAWTEGRCVTFDDTCLHEAWNRSGETRTVMILDTWNPYLTPEECAALKDIVEQVGDFNASAGLT